VVNNAADTSSLRAFLADVSSGELARLRRQLGLRGRNVGVYCGSLYKHKRIEFLLEAAKRIRVAVGDFELIVMGTGPDEAKVAEAARSERWIHYVGVQSGRNKAAFLELGHVFIMPGAVGLAILDGFAAGLPLLTTDCRLHGPEIAYLREGRNGFLTPNNMDEYVAAVVRTLRDRRLLSSLSQNCLVDAGNYSVEDMARRFAGGVVKALSGTRRDRCCAAAS
jgi:glycosyltransferase involved in cell wall biosynthesis